MRRAAGYFSVHTHSDERFRRPGLPHVPCCAVRLMLSVATPSLIVAYLKPIVASPKLSVAILNLRV